MFAPTPLPAPTTACHATALGLLLLLLLTGCDKDKAEEPNPRAHSEKVRQLSPTEQRAQHKAQLSLRNAIGKSLQLAFNRNRIHARKQRAEDSKENARPKLAQNGHLFSLMFQGNVHGEREDCGCKRNPMGGLTRRATMIDLDQELDSPEAQKWWGIEAAPGDKKTTLLLDAGDLFFPTATAHIGSKKRVEQRKAKELPAAEALVEAINLRPPDAYAVGERDLAYGLDTLQALQKKAKFPFLSANLTDAEHKPLFDGHVLLERDGHSIGIIALTDDTPRTPDYYDGMKLRAKPALDAYIRELQKLPKDVDLVLLLSNLGMRNSQKLTAELRKRNQRVDAVIVSNTGRQTRRPNWTDEVPLVEVTNRGKYLGRLDIYKFSPAGQPPHYEGASNDLLEAYDDYYQAYNRYLSAWRMHHKKYDEVLQLQEIIAANKGEAKTPAPDKSEDAANKKNADGRGQGKAAQAARAKKLQRLQDSLKTMRNRVEIYAEGTRSALKDFLQLQRQAQARSGQTQGKDQLFVKLIPLTLELKQEPATRKALDRWKGKIPGEPK